MPKGSKTIKIMKMSKKRRELTQVKAGSKSYIFLHINEQEISMYYDSKEIHAEKYLFWLCCTF